MNRLLKYFAIPMFVTVLAACGGGGGGGGYSSGGGGSGPPLTITTASLPGGTVGVAYSITLQATGGTPPYAWSVSQGSLPSWATLNASTGAITGTPNVASNTTLTFRVTDSNNVTTQTNSLTLFIASAPPPPLTITTTSLPSGVVGTVYSASLQTTGGTPPYTWSISQGSLPSWATLNASTGVISGTPNVAATTSLTFRVTDSNNVTTQTNSLNLVIAPAPPPTLTITTTSLPNGVVGTAYSATLQATGGTPPYAWSVSQGSLPSWATLNASTGAITGTPNVAATTSLTFRVTDSNNITTQTNSLNLVIAPAPPPPLTITTTSLPNGVVGTAYSASLQATGGTPPYTWSISQGSLPSWATLNATTGAITGTPNASGTTNFTVKVTDSENPAVSVTANLSLTVGASPIEDVAVDVNNTDLYKLNASDGTVVWGPVNLPNCGGMAVDPTDYSVYVGTTTHCGGSSAAIYKYDSTGAQVWEDTGYAACGTGGAYYIGNGGIAVDENSADPGIVLAMSGFFGNLGKINLAGTATLWCDGTNDLGRPSIVGSTGQIYDVTDAGPSYSYNTIYSATATGSLTSATACEGYTDSNPADGTLYLGGGMASNGCGLKLYQMSTSTLGNINWSVDLSTDVSSFDALALQPWSGGYIYAASASSSKIVVIDPATQSVVTTFSTVVAPNFIAVDPNGGNIYIASSAGDYVYAYSPSGVLVWTSPKLAGTISSLAAARDVVGNP